MVNLSTKKIFFLVISIVGLALAIVFFLINSNSEDVELRVSGSELTEVRGEWEAIIHAKGAKKAYALFLEEAPKNINVGTHTQAHVFGEALYNVEGINGIQYCDSSFEFGCYHSFFGSAIYTEGIQALSLFDEACKDAYGDKNLPCQHGIGHGLLVYTGYEKLFEALTLCEQISWQPIGGCTSGVFMEYNFHTMEAVETGGYIRPLEDDPYAPCSSLPEKHQQACYFDQVQWWLNIYSRDYEQVAVLCNGLQTNSDLRSACFRGIGNFLAADMNLEPLKITAGCTDAMPDMETNALCHQGATGLIFGNGSGKNEALQICEELEGTYQTECIRNIESL